MSVAQSHCAHTPQITHFSYMKIAHVYKNGFKRWEGSHTSPRIGTLSRVVTHGLPDLRVRMQTIRDFSNAALANCIKLGNMVQIHMQEWSNRG